MGRSLKHLSIRIKLTLIMVAASSVGLIITATTFIVREGPIFRTSMSRDLQSLASVLGANSAAPLAFGDQKFATELLSALRAVPHVRTAVLYDEAGKPFAQYHQHVDSRSGQSTTTGEPTTPREPATPAGPATPVISSVDADGVVFGPSTA